VRKTKPSGRRWRQSGAALITSLLLLLVLTVLGVVMMQTSRMQERMAGNTRDLNVALQGAEAALRYGEATIAAAPSAPFGTAAPCTVCQQFVLPVAMYDLSQFNWLTDPSAQTYGAGTVSANLVQANGVGLHDNPKYTVEYFNRVRDDLSPTASGVNYYQVTSYSTGASGSTNVVVQSTFGRRD
jgi:type IV pilus assembly protein PilX